MIKKLLILLIFIAFIAYLHYLRRIYGENPAILVPDAFLAGFLDCFIIGYMCSFIKNIKYKGELLPPIELKYILLVFKNKFLLFIFLFSAIPFIIVDDAIKSNILMHFLYTINLIIFVPLSIMIIGFSLKNNIRHYFKIFNFFDYIKNTILFCGTFLMLLIPTLYVLYNLKNLALMTIILTINVYIIHIFIFIWFYYLTKLILKKENSNE